MADIPVKWVVSSLQGIPAADFFFRDLYAAFDRGEDGTAVPRAQHLPPGELARARDLHRLPLGNELLPAMLSGTGRYELIDGHHRAARHVYEGHATIPIEVCQVSPMWQAMVGTLQGLYPDRPRALYQGIEHPYFDDWTQDRADVRIGLVQEAIAYRRPLSERQTYLDIGSCTGRFCREMAYCGKYAFGVDKDPRVVRVAEQLDTVFGTKVHYECHARPLDLVESGPGWGAITCLSVLHHLPQADAEQLLCRCHARADVLVVDAALPCDGAPGPWNVYGQWLREVLGPQAVLEELGATEGRMLYRITRG